MKLFRKKTGTKELHPFIARALMRINQILKFWAQWLQQKTNRYTSKKIKIILIFFCAGFISGSVLVVYHGFQKSNSNTYQVTLIQPVPILKKAIHPLISKKEFTKIHRFKLMLDSLETTDVIKFDSIQSLRPHLIDTINLLENYYYEQQSKK